MDRVRLKRPQTPRETLSRRGASRVEPFITPRLIPLGSNPTCAKKPADDKAVKRLFEIGPGAPGRL